MLIALGGAFFGILCCVVELCNVSRKFLTRSCLRKAETELEI